MRLKQRKDESQTTIPKRTANNGDLSIFKRLWRGCQIGSDAWLEAQPTIPFDMEIAKLWGRRAGNAQARGRPRPQNDTWIAACCIHHDVPLLTINQRDFEDFAKHEGLRLLR